MSSLLFRSTGAVSPLMFLPLHAFMAHVTARAWPSKRISYPLLQMYHAALFAAEHYTAEVPAMLADALPVLAPILFVTFAFTFYFSFKATVSKRTWAAGLACFLVGVPFLAGNDLGIPKDAVSDQKTANFDAHYTAWHVVVHCTIGLAFYLTTAGVPWDAAAAKSSSAQEPQELAPRSPHHTTLSPGRTLKNLDCASPKRSGARWAKPAKLE